MVPKFEKKACSDIIIIKDTYISYETELVVACILPRQSFRHNDYPHFKNQVCPLLCMLYSV